MRNELLLKLCQNILIINIVGFFFLLMKKKVALFLSMEQHIGDVHCPPHWQSEEDVFHIYC